MSLTDIQIQKAKPKEKQYKLADGRSMYLIVTPGGGKYWRLDYRFNGKRQTLSLGTFPSTSLKDARRKCEDIKSLITDGIDPSHQRKIMLTGNKDSFEAVATGQSTRDPTTDPKSAIHEYKPSEKVMGEKWRSIMAPGTSAIIIAAGLGSRMEALTNDKPKCMLEFGDKTLLQRQLDAYWACGVTDISVVRGYQKDKIHYDGLRYFENPDYKNNNILNSLFYAEEAITGHVICAYSDILFNAHVVQRVLEAQHDISVVVDIDWRGYYDGRRDHPLDEAENIIFDANNKVIAAGKAIATKNDVHGEFIGMMKFSPHGAEIFKRHFNRIKELYAGKPFQRAKVFEKSYLTDIIQDMTDIGIPIHCVIIERGWKEIDTIEDYEKALKDFDN
jgi:L-glutamine-phosphate cytidylyltransferase